MGLRVLLLKTEPEGTKKKKNSQTDSVTSEVSYLNIKDSDRVKN